MIRNLRTLALAMGAVLLLGALWASSASATATIWFEGENGIQTITGTNHPEIEDVFTITTTHPEPRTVKCKVAHYTNETSTVTTTQSEINVTPTYTECSSGVAGVTVNMNGCDYRFHTPTTDNGVRTSKVEIVCPTGKEIDIHASLFGTLKCTVTVEPQTPSGHAVFTNLDTGGGGANREVTVKITLTGIKYIEHKGSGVGACADSTTTSDGTFTGGAIMRGQTHSEEPKGIWIDV